VNLLLDTHIALWAITNSPRLQPAARELIASPRNDIWISTATIWEISIKHTLGRGDMPVSGEAAIAWFRQAGYGFLPIEIEHAAAVAALPPYHHDPFDRILVAQALMEPMRLMSHDPMVARYSDTVITI
jgi:PIN domain nuclease of toxin-antitoxin system